MGAFGKPGTFAPRKDSPWLLDLGHCALSEGVPWRLAPCPPGADGPFAVRALCACACMHCVCACVCVRAPARGLAEFQPLSTREPDLEVPVFPSAPLFHT